MHPQQQDVVVTEGADDGIRVKLECEPVAAELRWSVVAPGGSVEDDLLAGRQPEPLADVSGELLPARVPQQVIAGIAGFRDLTVEVEGTGGRSVC